MNATSILQETARERVVKDTLHHEFPNAINIQEIFNRQIEVKDER